MSVPPCINQTMIYQIYTGRWEAQVSGTNIVSSDTFQRLSLKPWDKLISQGVKTFYFLGVFEHNGDIIVTHESGKVLPPNQYLRVTSPFAITNHTAFHQELGKRQDFKHLIQTIHQKGGYVLVDFVPNHTSIAHPWVTSHPDYYVKNNEDFVIEFSGDVYKLNYQNPQLRREMIHIVEWIAKQGVDGIRCDMAHLVPVDFWCEAIGTVKTKYPGFAFVAEAYPHSLFDFSPIQALYTAGFDAIYNNGLFENLNKVIVELAPLSYLTEYLKVLPTNYPGTTINYFANHDDPVLNNKYDDPNLHTLAIRYLEALVAVSLFIPGCSLLYNGSLLGKTTRLAHHWFEPLEEQYLETDNPLPPVIKKLLSVRATLSLHDLTSLNHIHDCHNLLCFSKGKYLFAINLSPNPQSLTALHPLRKGLLHELSVYSSLQPGQVEIWSM